MSRGRDVRKKARKQTKEEAAGTVVAEIKITLNGLGQVNVEGPINPEDSMLFRQMMNGAEKAAIEFAKQKAKTGGSNIIVPTMQPPKDLLDGLMKKGNNI